MPDPTSRTRLFSLMKEAIICKSKLMEILLQFLAAAVVALHQSLFPDHLDGRFPFVKAEITSATSRLNSAGRSSMG